MKKRIIYLVSVYLLFVCIFLLEKPVFMLYNDALGRGYGVLDYLSVMFHGLSLDLTTAGYLTVIPWLLIEISWWRHRRTFPIRKYLSAYYVLISLVLSLIFVADLAIYPFWGFKLDSSVFLYIDSPKNVAASVSSEFLILHFAAIFLLAIVMSVVLIKVTAKEFPPVKMLSSQLGGTVVTLLIGGLLFLAIRGGFKESTANIGQGYYCNDEFLNHSAVNPAFSLLASASKTDDYASEFDYFTEEERASLFTGLYPTSGKNTMELLTTHRPNILIIVLEGFGASMVESLGGAKWVSPNLDRLSKEGVWFTECYANSFRTDRGTVCTLSGYQSFPDLSVMKIPAKSRAVPVLAQKLVERGYTTEFLYGGDINFTNMKSYLLQGGYQRLISDTDFSLGEHKNPWGVNDDITFARLYDMLKDRKPGDGLWHTAFLTLSSHEPFEVPYSRLKDAKPNAFAFTDHCLGEFIDKLRQRPVWDNLLVIILPDHGFFYPENEGTVNDMRIHHIPMLWLGGAVKSPKVIDKLMCQSDMAATLLGQLDISHEEYTFSRNVLGEEYVYPFVYYTYNNGFAFADSTGYSLVNTVSGMVTDESSSVSSDRRVRLGKAILQSSYDDLGAR